MQITKSSTISLGLTASIVVFAVWFVTNYATFEYVDEAHAGAKQEALEDNLSLKRRVLALELQYYLNEEARRRLNPTELNKKNTLIYQIQLIDKELGPTAPTPGN